MRYHHVLILITAVLLGTAVWVFTMPLRDGAAACGSAFKPNEEDAILADVMEKFTKTAEYQEVREFQERRGDYKDLGSGLSGKAVQRCAYMRERAKVTALLITVVGVLIGPLGWINQESFTRRRGRG